VAAGTRWKMMYTKAFYLCTIHYDDQLKMLKLKTIKNKIYISFDLASWNERFVALKMKEQIIYS